MARTRPRQRCRTRRHPAGSTTLTLSDNTRITFLGIGSASALQGHVI